MANDAYKVKADVSLPRAIREVETLAGGEKVYETEGRSYAAGQYVFAEDITPPLREKIENGDLDHLLEPVSREEAEKGQVETAQAEFGIFIPEHEAERVVLEEYGHQIVPRDQVLELKSAGADAAKEAQEEAKSDGADERPGITAPEVPSLADVSRGEANNVPSDKDAWAEDSALTGVEQPPGVRVGEDKAQAEGAAPKPRKRPAASGSKKADSKKDDE